MIRLAHSGTEGEDEMTPSFATTWRVEWDRTDEEGKELPRGEYVARFVTTYGTASRRIRLRVAEGRGA